jgi:hypothetical protein
VVPSVSTIANAMGRAGDGREWIAVAENELSLGSERTEKVEKMECLLGVMRDAMGRNEPAACNAAFFEWQKEATDGAEMDYTFVKKVLDIVIQPGKALYSPKIVRHLLQRDLVSAGMIGEPLLEMMRSHHDWVSRVW